MTNNTLAQLVRRTMDERTLRCGLDEKDALDVCCQVLEDLLYEYEMRLDELEDEEDDS